jgi:TRAP-type C4-dicarboxylate transport system permease large subunit
VYRSLSWEDFIKSCAKACKTTGVVLFLIGISNAFGYFLAMYSVPELTGQLMATVTENPWMIFLMINLVLFLLGTFLDMAPALLICTPIFLPIAQKFGMDPTQFGVVILLNCALGLNTPPVGTTSLWAAPSVAFRWAR